MRTEDLLADAKRRLERLYGARLRAVVLHGSEARGTATADSDVDLLVVLASPCDAAAEVTPIVDALYPLLLRSDRRIDAQAVDEALYRAAEHQLYRTAQEEGVVL